MKEKTPSELTKINILEQSGHPSYFRRDVHELLAFGYKKVYPTINANTEEPTITIRIAKAIDAGLNSYGELPERLLIQPYGVCAESAEIENLDTKNLKDKHIFYDIVFEESTRSVPRRRYTFEAKRLKKNKYGIGSYCKDGVMRFINDTYASTSPEAAMIGFYQDADIDYWFKQLKAKFEKDKKNELRIVDHLTLFQIISDFSHEWLSVHERKSTKKIFLFHIFLAA